MTKDECSSEALRLPGRAHEAAMPWGLVSGHPIGPKVTSCSASAFSHYKSLVPWSTVCGQEFVETWETWMLITYNPDICIGQVEQSLPQFPGGFHVALSFVNEPPNSPLVLLIQN